MRVTVIGGGVTGLAAAWYLHADGHEVTVVDRNDSVGLDASFANGGQLSYSYVAPLAGPGVFSKLPGWLTRADSPIRFRPRLDIAQWQWLLKFVVACNQRQSEVSTRRLLKLAFFSRDLMHDLVREHPAMSFDYANAGKLVVHRSQQSFDAACRLLAYQRELGCDQEAFDAAACLAKEPALAHIGSSLTGGIWTGSEDSGDCYRFCVALYEALQQRGVTFRLNTAVTRLSDDPKGRVYAYAGSERLESDHVVIAAGSRSKLLLNGVTTSVSLYPLKGYSLTLPLAPASVAPAISITDFDRKIVYARLGDRLRVAGMADVTGWDADPDPRRIAALRTEARSAFPDAGPFDQAKAWCGLRPATPTGVPIIGATRYPNLWLDLGQGALGFTLSLGSGRLLADQIGKRKPSVAIDGLALPDH